MKKKRNSPFSIEFWMEKGYNEDEAKEQVSIRRPSNIKYWLNKGYTEDEAKEQLYKLCAKGTSKKLLIERFGKKLGTKKYNERINISKKNSPRCIEYWINKGYTKEESKDLVKKHQSKFSLKKCIEKYGDKLGREKFKERQLKWQATLNEKSEFELNVLNKKKDATSISFMKCKYPDTWEIEYFNRNLYDTDVSECIKKCYYKNTIDELVNEICSFFSEYKYGKFIRVLKSEIIKYKFNLDNDKIKKLISKCIHIKCPNFKKQTYGTLILYKNSILKSQSELELFKFLEENNIKFEYEISYPFHYKNKKYPMKCDFYINEFDLYIEYAGLIKNKSYLDKIKHKKEKCLEMNLNSFISNSIEEIKEKILKLYEKNNKHRDNL